MVEDDATQIKTKGKTKKHNMLFQELSAPTMKQSTNAKSSATFPPKQQ